MQGILEASAPVTRNPARRAPNRRLSVRRVRGLVRVGQPWSDRAGGLWEVRQIHRKDRQVALVGIGERPRYVSFQELGRDYRPVEQ